MDIRKLLKSLCIAGLLITTGIGLVLAFALLATKLHPVVPILLIVFGCVTVLVYETL